MYSPVPSRVLVGAQPLVVRWIQVPKVNDTVNLMVYRLPLVDITTDGQALTDVAEQHHIHLLNWMKHLAHRKSDPELFDLKKSETFGNLFKEYCTVAFRESERAKHRTRVVAYGGL